MLVIGLGEDMTAIFFLFVGMIEKPLVLFRLYCSNNGLYSGTADWAGGETFIFIEIIWRFNL